MTYREAIRWLDDHGGRWCVRATQTTCLVIATLGPASIEIPVRTLASADVDAALVASVAELQQRVGERGL